MSNQISEKRKQKEHRGSGNFNFYKPYIQTREFNSNGTCSNPVDWITGRTVELMSQGEAECWHLLRWEDDIADINEQFPLNLYETNQIARRHGINPARNGKVPMTTDFYITYKNGLHAAISLKSSKTDIKSHPRTLEKLMIEKLYWISHQTQYLLVYKDELNHIKAHNIRQVIEYYHSDTVHDDISILKHLIATKQINVNMEAAFLDYQNLVAIHAKEIELWKQSK